MTFAEIRYGVERLADAERRASIATWLERSLRPLFAGRVLPVSEEVMLHWRLMLEAGRRCGHTFGRPDLLIAATAALEDLIVSQDVTHFITAGVPTLDPWSATYTAADGTEYTINELSRADLVAQLG